MRTFTLFVVALVASTNASWFGSDQPAYADWDSSQLKTWLIEHNLYSPSLNDAPPSTLKAIVQANYDSATGWTRDQYNQAQKTFENIRNDAFDTWSESRLREFLLEQGVVSPSGPREELVLLAKSKYAVYTNAASSLGAQASASAGSFYNNAREQASKSLSSIGAEATHQTAKALQDSKDYIYSTWDDNRLRTYLEEKGLLKTNAQKSREEMLGMMRDAYASVTDPVYDAWSDSYMREWLVDHGIIAPNTSPSTMTRTDLQKLLNNYYYDANQYVWSTWSDSDMKKWLVRNGYLKSDAQVSREKMQRMINNSYKHATSTIFSGHSDSALRDWLVEHGYKRSDVQVKRDELVAMISKQYNDAVAKGDKFFTDGLNSLRGDYLTWPDARLRAYLRQQGLSEEKIPGDRPGLIQETRIRWVQTTNTAESIYLRIKEIINSGVGAVEERLSQIFNVLTGVKEDAKVEAEKQFEEKKARMEKEFLARKKEAEKAYRDARNEAEKEYNKAKAEADRSYHDVKKQAKASSEKLKTEL